MLSRVHHFLWSQLGFYAPISLRPLTTKRSSPKRTPVLLSERAGLSYLLLRSASGQVQTREVLGFWPDWCSVGCPRRWEPRRRKGTRFGTLRQSSLPASDLALGPGDPKHQDPTRSAERVCVCVNLDRCLRLCQCPPILSRVGVPSWFSRAETLSKRARSKYCVHGSCVYSPFEDRGSSSLGSLSVEEASKSSVVVRPRLGRTPLPRDGPRGTLPRVPPHHPTPPPPTSRTSSTALQSVLSPSSSPGSHRGPRTLVDYDWPPLPRAPLFALRLHTTCSSQTSTTVDP